MYSKLILAGLFLFTSAFTSAAQIGQSKWDIIAEYGQNYKPGKTDDGLEYIYYEKEYTTEQSGTYTQIKAIYFFQADDGTKICHKWLIMEPSPETNAWVKLLNKDFVKTGNLEWKDYETNVLYKIEVKDGYCLLKVEYEFKQK